MSTPRIRPVKEPPDERLATLAEAIGCDPGGDGIFLSPVGQAPCSRACPVGINVKRYVGLVAGGRYEEALAVIREDNPFAAVCGYLCSRPCEAECALLPGGAPIPIRAVKRLAARMVAESGVEPSAPHRAGTGRRIAVVGAGPTGLTAAWALSRLGHEVAVLDARDRPGGLLACEVPEQRLPRWALAADLAYIQALGVTIRCGAPVLRPESVTGLLEEGWDAVLLATGACRGLHFTDHLSPGIRGEMDAMTLHREMARGADPPPFRSAAVLGGGPMALAAARRLAAVGRGRVTLVHAGTRATLPADPVDVEAALASGVRLASWCRPLAVISEKGRVVGVRLLTLLGAGRDGAGRQVTAPGPERLLEAELVISAMGREPALGYLAPAPGTDDRFRCEPGSTLPVDTATLETSFPGVFAAGEVVTGPRTIIEAVAAGRRAARSIHARLTSRHVSGMEPENTLSGHGGGYRLGGADERHSGWRLVPEVSPGDDPLTPFGRRSSAQEMSESEGDLVDAARRCLGCGPCQDCQSCSIFCPERHAVAPGALLVRLDRHRLQGLQGLELADIRACVEPDLCRGCGVCEERCPYHIPRVRRIRPEAEGAPGSLVAVVDISLCRGCGICVGSCPTGAMQQGGLASRDVAQAIDAIFQRHPGKLS